MNVLPSLRSPLCALTALLSFGLSSDAFAQSVSTPPVGAVTVTVAAGTGTSRVATVLSFPLTENPLASGQTAGVITGVGASTITNANAGWTAGALSVAASPYAIQITSGAAEGSTFMVSTAGISANTSTTVTIASDESSLVDLLVLGVVAGDKYKLIPCDTLNSLLGTPETMGVVGGLDSTTADIVKLLVGTTYRQYYYKTGTTNSWRRVGAETASNDVPVRPDSLVIYNRIGNTPINFLITGNVPVMRRQAIVRNSGLTTLSLGWPATRTLSQLGIHNLPNWGTAANSSNLASADLVQVLVGTTFRQYYYNGTSWYRVGAETLSNSLVIPLGAGVIISRKGTALGADMIEQDLPYSL